MTKSGENICEQCSKTFKSKKLLERHERTHDNKEKKCKMCKDVAFNNDEDYNFHIRDVHNGQSGYYFMCSECGRQFKTKGELTLHVTSKCGTIKLFKCKVCEKELMSAGSLHNHMLRHKGEPTQMCRFCAKLFFTAGQLKVHERIHTQEKPFICEVCGKCFCHRQSLITHSTLHTGIKPYTCENCSDSFSCIGNLLKHRKTHAECAQTPLRTHLVQNPSTKMKIKINMPACTKLRSVQREKEVMEYWKVRKEKLLEKTNEKCETVDALIDVEIKELDIAMNSSGATLRADNIIDPEGSIVNNVDYINKHDTSAKEKSIEPRNKDNSSNNLNIDCLDNTFMDDDTQCVTYYQTDEVDNYDDSRNSTSEEDDEVDQSNDNLRRKSKSSVHKEEIQCKYCQKSYSNPVWLKKHENQHSSESNGNFKCSCCKLNFETKDECFEHQRKEHSKLLSCIECDKIYANPTSLKAHEKYFHAGKSRKSYTYICENCGKQFPQKAALLIHKEHNCGEAPKVQCEVCDKTFTTNWSRSSHMKVHSDKKLLCKFCGKKFHRKGQLKIHERSHTGEKPFTCLYCPKAFAYRDSLITHSSLHTGIKPHLCEACGSRFSCLGNLIKHKTTHASSCGVWLSKNKDVIT